MLHQKQTNFITSKNLKTMSTKINTSALLNSFKAYNNSFNAAIRYIFDLSKESPAKIPASPAKDDKSETAKALRKEIKAIEANNAIIADAKRIVETFAITANDIKDKAISALRNKIVAKLPNVDETGAAVKFAKLPSYLKNEVKEYATTLQVVPASWIEAICAATDNVEGYRKEYTVTLPPVIEEGKVIEGASGNIVNAKCEIIGSDTIFAIWNKEAKINNIANAAGRATTQATKAELKAK